ncbi:MAG: PAS domain S-box protein [Acidobacteria bacterium]|nr:PAS domain S-box protein [Acidobacteriota bacterium]
MTRRKPAEEKLHQTKETLSAILQAAPVAIVSLDPDGNVRLWSKGAEELFGWTEQELLGRPYPLVPENPHSHELWRRALQGEVFKGVSVRRRKKDGAMVDAALSTAPLRNSKGQITGSVGVLVDVTRWNQLEAQFLQAQKMEAVGRLTGEIAHDFNNLLTGMMGFTQLALDKTDPTAPSYADLQELHKLMQRAARLTSQLLLVSRKEAPRRSRVNLNALAQNISGLLKNLVGEKIDLVFEAGSEIGNVWAEPSQLEQVIMNLVLNARDAMTEGGRLTIETHPVRILPGYDENSFAVPVGSYVVLAVTDTGCGMDQATAARIFEPFFTTKTAGKGTGLGLSVVYTIVQQHEGFIKVYSEPGDGTTFKIYLPRMEKRGAMQSSSVSEKIAMPQGNETILVVEDEDAVRLLVERILQGLGYKVMASSSTEEAKTTIEGYPGKVDLVLSDVIMPGEDVHGFLRDLSVRHPSLKVLYMSGYAEKAMAAKLAGAAFLPKPFAPSVLAHKIREVLEAPQDES